MNAFDLKLARTIAQSNEDLSAFDDTVLFGFGCPDFKRMTVDVRVVAKCMRWQCQQWNGKWDERQYNEDLPHYRRNVQLATITGPEARARLHTLLVTALEATP